MRSAISAAKKIAEQSPRDGEVHVLPVQGNVYMLVADGTNITASVGPEGVALVNTGSAQMSDKILAAVNQLAQTAVTPTATNQRRCHVSRRLGMVESLYPHRHQLPGSHTAHPLYRQHQRGGRACGRQREDRAVRISRRAGRGLATVEGAPVIAHENVLNRMSAPAGKQPAFPQAAWPPVSYFDEFYKLPAYFNGEGITVYHAPAANTDGDSIVRISAARRSSAR